MDPHQKVLVCLLGLCKICTTVSCIALLCTRPYEVSQALDVGFHLLEIETESPLGASHVQAGSFKNKAELACDEKHIFSVVAQYPIYCFLHKGRLWEGASTVIACMS